MNIALGLMSGTSCDGVSAAVARFPGRGRVQLIAHRTDPYPSAVSTLLHHSRDLSTSQLSQINMLLGELFALTALRLLRQARLHPRSITVIGSHGHTMYHGPDDRIPSTLQLGEPAVIAERTGIPVVADFRPRDIVAGGQGAPLIPFFDDYCFGGGPPRTLQNIGGIANVTLVGRGLTPIAFDTGPGNGLLDAVVRRATRGRQRFDRDGGLAARGRVDERALRRLLGEPYFHLPPPKSTGPEFFNEQWLRPVWSARSRISLPDRLATLTRLTARSIADSYRRFLPVQPREVIVSGGGCRNRTLMRDLRHALAPTPVRLIDSYGVPAQAKEPAAFALLAWRAWRRQPNHLPSATGASAARILGCLTLA